MLILMKQHGRTIVCCVMAVFVIGIVFSVRLGTDTGFIRIAYGMAMKDRTNTDVTAYGDIAAVNAAVTRSKPEITYTYAKTLPGKKVNINSMFFAEDADGNPAAVEITDILDSFGKSVLYLSREDKRKKNAVYNTADFLFSSSGIYTVYVKAIDAEKKTTYRQYKLLVSGG